MSEQTNNLFFDSTAPIEVEASAVDLSNLTQAEIIPDQCVLMKLEINTPGFQKQFASSEVIDEAGIDNTLIKTSKSLIDKRYLDPITKLDSRMRADMYQIGMRPKFLGNGNVIVPNKLLHYTIRRLEFYQTERAALIDTLIGQYEEAKAETLARNPDLYREEEYPTQEELRSKFNVSWNIFSVAFPDVMDRIESATVTEMGTRVAAALDKQRQAQETQLAEAVEECKQGLRSGFYELVSNLEDKVRGIGTERKVFKPGFIANFRTFLETFDAKNIMNDEELAAQVAKAKAVLSGVSPDAIRNSMDVRVKLETELGSIKNDLASMTENPGRKVSF